MRRKFPAFLLAIALLLCLFGCDDETESYETEAPSEPQHTQTPQTAGETWAVYWYLCGSDLESGGGAASVDIEELVSVAAGDNVTVVIQTGGAEEWMNPSVDPDASQRFVYDANGFALVDEGPARNMGESETLADFLGFCAEEYPADRAAFVFWNHGAGSVGGIAFDEQYGFDSLTLDEVASAMESVFGDSPAAPPLELVGFDACLMATIDTAAVLQKYAGYMVASQELEPGIGWDYTGLMTALTENPGMTGAQLGKSICDTYAAACKEEDVAEDITLSVIDLSRIDALLAAYHNIGVEYLAGACSDARFFGQYSRGAKAAENYGGNTREDGYTNMADLGDLVRNSAELAPACTQSVLDALEDCVVYRINGPYRARSGGLSCYYAYDGDENSLTQFAGIAASEPYVYLYEYAVSGSLSSQAMDYIADMGFTDMPGDAPPEPPLPQDPEQPAALETVESLELEDFPVYVTDDGIAVLELGTEIAAQLSGVYVQLCYFDEEEDIILLLGRDNDLVADWDAGVFQDNFRGVWGAIDGCLVYMELICEGDDYNLYTVPILLNGEAYNLRVSYDYNEEAYFILGARQGIDDYGMSDRNLRQLQPGDVVTTLHYAATLSGDDGFELYATDEIAVTADTRFHEEDMGDGTFILMYEMVDIAGDYALSDIVEITVDGEDIYLEAA